MENKTANPNSFDPQADLDLLDRSKSSVAVNDVLDFGPWWYAPLFATCMGGLTLFGREESLLVGLIYAIAGFGSGAVVAVHDYRRRTVRPKFSGRVFWFLFVMVLGAWAAIGAWGTAVSTIGYEDFVPGPAIVAWLITTVVFLGIRQVCHTLLARRQVAA